MSLCHADPASSSTFFRDLIGYFFGLFVVFVAGIQTTTEFPERRAKLAAKPPDATRTEQDDDDEQDDNQFADTYLWHCDSLQLSIPTRFDGRYCNADSQPGVIRLP
jgi:hypothetical protein